LTAALRELRDDGSDVAAADLTFTAVVESFGDIQSVELQPGDASMTNENLEDYINQHAHSKLTSCVTRQFDGFSRGFRVLFNSNPASTIFQYDELDILVSGMPEIDWDSLREGARYTNGYTRDTPVVQWLWEALAASNLRRGASAFPFPSAGYRRSTSTSRSSGPATPRSCRPRTRASTS
jgi:hypothetical protein